MFNRLSAILAKLILVMQDIWGKLSIERSIKRFDKSVDLDILPTGFELFTNCFQPPALDFDFNYNGYGTFQTRDLSLTLAKIARDQILKQKNLISSYLPNPVRLDDMYLTCVDPRLGDIKGISEGWHHDHCGHRLKMFICLRGDRTTPTLYIPGSHKRSYQMNFNQFLRYFGFSNYKISQHSVSLGLASGDVGIFDTNGSHRGGFTEESSERICLVLEFISVDKSNYISKYCPCGPGGSRSGAIFLSQTVKEVLDETGFLDESLLKQKNELFSYSILNL